MYYAYIIQLVSGDYYAGYSANLKQRLQEHENESVKTTRASKPQRLVFYAAFTTEDKARSFEQYLKSSSGFAFRNKRLI